MAILQQRGLTRFAFCLFLWFVCTKCDFDWVFSFVDDFIPPEQLEVSDISEPVPPPSYPANNQQQGITTENDDEDEEQMRMFRIISEHCLPKLVCELHAKSYGAVFSESEKSLMSLIGTSSLGMNPSKYHYAAHFGQLIQGYEGHGCHNMYPMCPFSGEDVQQIARKIPIR